MSFASDMAKFAENAGKSLEATGQGIALSLFTAIIKDTPVDTGRARGNWQATIGTPARGVIDRSGDAGAIAEVTSESKNFESGTVFYLTNSLPYIYGLEYGKSRVKAPEGMVRKNVARIQSIVAAEARKNRV